ncbi:MAG: chromate transporter, partial [Pseudomonadota bacterium]
GIVTLWVTFLPCFLWIFAGAPYIERLTNAPRIDAALRAVTAAVVGVILNLSLFFALHVLFGTVGSMRVGLAEIPVPELASFNLRALLLTLFAGALMLGAKLSVLKTLLIMILISAGLALFA